MLSTGACECAAVIAKNIATFDMSMSEIVFMVEPYETRAMFPQSAVWANTPSYVQCGNIYIALFSAISPLEIDEADNISSLTVGARSFPRALRSVTIGDRCLTSDYRWNQL